MEPTTPRNAVEPFDGSLTRLEPLVARWPFLPHRWAADRSAPALRRLALQRLNESVRSDGARSWIASCAGTVVGLAILRPLDWDSRVLGMSAARLDLVVAREAGASVKALIEAAVEDAALRRIRHISVRVDAADDGAIHACEQSGFLNVDALLTFAARADELPRPHPPDAIALRSGTPSDAHDIGELAAASFVHGRFHSDPSVPSDRAESVYRTWGQACCTGAAADAVIVASVGGAPAGFIACRMHPDTAVHLERSAGTITLIASDDRFRGRGVGTALVAAGAEWFRSQGAGVVEVGTQLRNVAAARLYERCGFRLISGALSFRTVIES